MPTSSNDMRLQTDMTYTSDGAYVSSVSDQDGNTVTNTYTYDKYGNVASMGINGTIYIKIDKSVDFYNEVVYIYCVE